MLFIIAAVLITFAAITLLSRLRRPGGVNGRHLGSMSERWIAEQRSSRGS